MAPSGWKRLREPAACFRGDGRYPIPAYSEFMPPPLLGCKPYGAIDTALFADDDPFGWRINEFEERLELRPGLEQLGRQILRALIHLGHGDPAHGIAHGKLKDNPFWPENLAAAAGKLKHERYVALLPLALSRTQDDKGRVRWSLFGGSEQGPARAFWKAFFTAPGRELPPEDALGFLRRLLHEAYEIPFDKLGDLREAGFRILARCDDLPFAFWRAGRLPKWTTPLLWEPRHSLRGVTHLLTFRPFATLPAAVQRAYLTGELHLVPFPGSLFYWGVATYLELHRELPFAVQIPLLHTVSRHEDPRGIRVPQSGWLHEPHPGAAEPDHHYGPVRNTYKRTHRWARIQRHEDELCLPGEDRIAHVLFSTDPDDVGLYGKPMARNAQLWTPKFELLLDGPRASSEDIRRAAHALAEEGMFGYRFLFPAMRVGQHEVYFHRLLAAYQSPKTREPHVMTDAPLGYLTAYPAEAPRLDKPIELWPRLLQREEYLAALELFDHDHDARPFQTAWNVRKLLDVRPFFAPQRTPRALARQLLTVARRESLDAWLHGLPERAKDTDRGRRLAAALQHSLEPEYLEPPPPLTYRYTADRDYEVRYWKTIAHLTTGRFVNKDNADCVTDSATRRHQKTHDRDLEALGDYLISYYERLIADHRMTGKALAGDMPFYWRTDFPFSWMGGWQKSLEGPPPERNIVVVIPGRDRRRAVVMADHYDTAYMEDCYGKDKARLAASGADDNHSATAALMLGAEVFLELSKKGKLGCDIWLVHLTGEEFPSDCLGARHLCERLVERSLKLRLPNGQERDLSRARCQGVYVLDMVAHNNDHEHDVFQITPGTGRASLWLAYQAHLAARAWNAGAREWNTKPARRDRPRCRRSADPAVVPDIAPHPILSGEVRLPYSRRSTLFNTDGQIFSDAGVPVVLFIENYDINRVGYHDTHDTMENIDLDYGSAVSAIAIESVVRAATEKPPA